MKLGTEKHRAALKTDNAWQAELEKVFGKQAGDKRYVRAGKGEPGTALRAAYEARQMAQEAWHADGEALGEESLANRAPRLAGGGSWLKSS